MESYLYHLQQNQPSVLFPPIPYNYERPRFVPDVHQNISPHGGQDSYGYQLNPPYDDLPTQTMGPPFSMYDPSDRGVSPYLGKQTRTPTPTPPNAGSQPRHNRVQSPKAFLFQELALTPSEAGVHGAYSDARRMHPPFESFQPVAGPLQFTTITSYDPPGATSSSILSSSSWPDLPTPGEPSQPHITLERGLPLLPVGFGPVTTLYGQQPALELPPTPVSFNRTWEAESASRGLPELLSDAFSSVPESHSHPSAQYLQAGFLPPTSQALYTTLTSVHGDPSGATTSHSPIFDLNFGAESSYPPSLYEPPTEEQTQGPQASSVSFPSVNHSLEREQRRAEDPRSPYRNLPRQPSTSRQRTSRISSRPRPPQPNLAVDVQQTPSDFSPFSAGLSPELGTNFSLFEQLLAANPLDGREPDEGGGTADAAAVLQTDPDQANDEDDEDEDTVGQMPLRSPNLSRGRTTMPGGRRGGRAARIKKTLQERLFQGQNITWKGILKGVISIHLQGATRAEIARELLKYLPEEPPDASEYLKKRISHILSKYRTIFIQATKKKWIVNPNPEAEPESP